MKFNTWLIYTIYAIIIVIVIVLGQYILEAIESSQMLYFNFCLINVVAFILYGSLGFLLGLEYIVNQSKKDGSWRLNMPKFLCLGSISLYFSFGLIISNTVMNVFSYPIMILYHNGPVFTILFQLVFGYVLATSLYKEKIQ